MTPILNKDSSLGVIQKNSDSRLTMVLQWDGVPRDVSASTIKAQIVDPSTAPASVVGASVSLSSATPGANWAHGVVVVVIPASVSSLINGADMRLVVYENDGTHEWAYPMAVRVDDLPAVT
jgi:hypothetical protein